MHNPITPFLKYFDADPKWVKESRCKEKSVKWMKYKEQDILPFWIADTDFCCSDEIKTALLEAVQRSTLGYANGADSLNQAFIPWAKKKYNWELSPEQILWRTAMVPFLNLISRTFAGPNGKIATPIPIYYHLFNAPLWANKELTLIPYLKKEKTYTLDFEKLEDSFRAGVKLFLLTNPFNPIGRGLTEEELVNLGDLAEKYDVLICSDEIHADILLEEEKKHLPLASLKQKYSQRTITLMGPTKAFNIAGLSISCSIIQNPELQKRMLEAARGILPDANCLAYLAAEAAYSKSESWLNANNAYLKGNRDCIYDFFLSHPDYELAYPLESTYLAWVKALKIPADQLLKTFEAVGVGISDGTQFHGPGFFRLNFGCSQALLKEGLRRISTI